LQHQQSETGFLKEENGGKYRLPDRVHANI